MDAAVSNLRIITRPRDAGPRIHVLPYLLYLFSVQVPPAALCVLYVFSLVIDSDEPTVLLLPELRPSFLNRILNLKQHLNNTFKLIYKEDENKS